MKRMMFAVVAMTALVSLEALASHYDLESIGLVDAATMKRFASLDIRTTEDLYNATRSQRRLVRFAAKVKVRRSQARDWRDFCEMLYIRGAGPKVVRVLRLAGVRRLAAMAREKPDDLLDRIRKANRKHGVLGKLPGLGMVEDWIEQARDFSRKHKRKAR